MATKRAQISELIQSDMSQRNLNGFDSSPAGSAGGPSAHRGGKVKKPKEAVKIRLDAGDWQILQDIAERQGTKASILIRQAVKEIIRKSGAGY